jgi:aminoglycoside N3'-acetyltransferase
MRTFSAEDLAATLRDVNVAANAVLLVHSSLLHLGAMAGVAVGELPAAVYRVLRDAVGARGTVAVPAFNFDFCQGACFDPLTTPAKGMGAFSEYVRGLSEARRSKHPMQSIAAVGPDADWLCARDTPSSFDPDGPFDRLVRADARVLLLGAPFQAVSLVHLAEEQVGVPYRYWKSFTGPCRVDGWIEQRTYRMYVRDLARDPRLRLDPIERALAAEGALLGRALGGGRVQAFFARDFLRLALAGLRADPEWLVRERVA